MISVVDYYAHGRKVVRHDPMRHYDLVQIRPTTKEARLLPIFSDAPNAGADSPLVPYIHPDERDNTFPTIPPSASTASLEHTSDMVSHLLSPSGPWRLRFNVQLPDCDSTMRFTNKGPGARIAVMHRLKTTLRVAKGIVDEKSDNKKLKMFDIIIETPIHILAVGSVRSPNFSLILISVAFLSVPVFFQFYPSPDLFPAS